MNASVYTVYLKYTLECISTKYKQILIQLCVVFICLPQFMSVPDCENKSPSRTIKSKSVCLLQKFTVPIYLRKLLFFFLQQLVAAFWRGGQKTQVFGQFMGFVDNIKCIYSMYTVRLFC